MDKDWDWQRLESGAFLEGFQEGNMEDWVDWNAGWQCELVGNWTYFLLNWKRSNPFGIELSGCGAFEGFEIKVQGIEEYLVTNLEF